MAAIGDCNSTRVFISKYDNWIHGEVSLQRYIDTLLRDTICRFGDLRTRGPWIQAHSLFMAIR